jgi:hypothetical protein
MMKTPNSKPQNPKKLQIPKSKGDSRRMPRGFLEFGVWDFFGVWSLEFGV